MQLIAELQNAGAAHRGAAHRGSSSARSPRGSAHVRAVSASYGRMAFYYILQALDFPPGSEIVLPALTFWVMPEMARRRRADAGVCRRRSGRRSTSRRDAFERGDHAADRRGRADAPLGTCRATWTEILEIAQSARAAGDRGLRARARARTYRGRPVGTFGDAAIFSFQTLKPLNAYGGGMAVTRDPALGARVAALAAAEPPPTIEDGRSSGSGTAACMRIATRPRDLHLDAVPARCTRARGCTGASTCTSGSRSGRSIRCRADYRAAAVSNVQAAHCARRAGAPRRVDGAARSSTRARMSEIARRCARRAGADRAAGSDARVLPVLRLRAVARRSRGRVPAARRRHRDAARGRLHRARSVRRRPTWPRRARGRRRTRSRFPCTRG